MRIIYFGSSAFSVPALRALADQTVCVVTRKGKPKGRGYGLDDNEVKKTAIELRLPLVEIDSFKDEAVKSLPDYKAELFMTASFGLIVPRWVLDMPSLGPVNIHPSLLPRHRGPSPMQWAIYSGDEMTGITFIRMNEQMDAGDIIYQEQTSIHWEEDFFQLSERLASRAADLSIDIVNDIGRQGMVGGVAQQHESATFTPMITKEMGKIDWTKSSREICNQVRAFVSWPTAYTFLDGKALKIFSVGELNENNPSPKAGLIREVTKEGLVVETGRGSILVKDLQLENKKRMSAYTFAQGYRGLAGCILS